MKIKAVFFDLDGTLLPMDQDEFVKAYFKGLSLKLANHGYDPKKLIESIWLGTQAMLSNKGEQLNEEAFWNRFADIYGESVKKDSGYFDEFYRNDFDNVKEVCGYTPKAASVVEMLHSKGVRTILATNPIFPAIATEKRISWAGLSPDMFELYTTYENSRYCKPNLNYYRDILDRLALNAEECIMVGNDVGDDMIAAELGMKVFLLSTHLINSKNKDISGYAQGDFDALIEYLETMI